jgi:signal transduction histidine kinase
MTLTSLHKKNKSLEDESVKFHKLRLQELEKLASFGEVLGGVAHEINNPLQIILGKAQILLMRLSPEGNSSKSIEDLKAIERAAQRISDLINGLNDLTHQKPEDRKSNIDIDLNYLIHSILSLIKASLKDKKIELSLDSPPDLPKVKGNPSKLKELFLFLTLNAKQRINWGGKLRISFKKEKDFLKIEFSDEGEGLPEEIEILLEEPLSMQIPGKSCFGILNSYQILREYQEELEIRSCPGKGNTIGFKLPFV